MPSRAMLLCVTAGLLLGAWARGLDQLDAPTAHWLSALGGPWLIAAFATGATASSRRAGATRGAAVLVVGVVAYYLLFRFVEQRTSTIYAGAMIVCWSAGAVPIGAAFGYAGAAWRATRGALSTGLIAGALLGEALLLRLTWHGPSAMRVLHAEALAGLVAALMLTRHRTRAIAAAAICGGALLVAELATRETLRAAGWAGA